MVKCKVIMQFYDNVEGRNRKKGEEFECLPERAEFLSGKNENKIKVIDVIEVIPDENKKTENKGKTQELKEEKPKKKGRKKIDTVD